MQTISFLGHGGKYDSALERVVEILCRVGKAIEIVCIVDTVCCFVGCFEILG